MSVRTLNLVLPEEIVQTIEAQVASARFVDASDLVRARVEKLSVDQDWLECEADPDEWIAPTPQHVVATSKASCVFSQAAISTAHP